MEPVNTINDYLAYLMYFLNIYADLVFMVFCKDFDFSFFSYGIKTF